MCHSAWRNCLSTWIGDGRQNECITCCHIKHGRYTEKKTYKRARLFNEQEKRTDKKEKVTWEKKLVFAMVSLKLFQEVKHGGQERKGRQNRRQKYLISFTVSIHSHVVNCRGFSSSAPHSYAVLSVMCSCVHWGLQLAHQTHSSRDLAPPLQPTSPPPSALWSLLLQRDGQLVRLGEVAFEVHGSAEASLFAHIKGEEI